jgi:CrcB protein
MKDILLIAIGGGAGAVSRYGMGKMIAGFIGTRFPWGTLAVNLSGSLLIGLFYGLFEKTVLPVEYKLIITIGFLGAFTTFLTFSLENIHLFRNGEVKLVCFNIAVSNIAGMLCVAAGFLLAAVVAQQVQG